MGNASSKGNIMPMPFQFLGKDWLVNLVPDGRLVVILSDISRHNGNALEAIRELADRKQHIRRARFSKSFCGMPSPVEVHNLSDKEAAPMKVESRDTAVKEPARREDGRILVRVDADQFGQLARPFGLFIGKYSACEKVLERGETAYLEFSDDDASAMLAVLIVASHWNFLERTFREQSATEQAKGRMMVGKVRRNMRLYPRIYRAFQTHRRYVTYEEAIKRQENGTSDEPEDYGDAVRQAMAPLAALEYPDGPTFRDAISMDLILELCLVIDKYCIQGYVRIVLQRFCDKVGMAYLASAMPRYQDVLFFYHVAKMKREYCKLLEQVLFDITTPLDDGGLPLPSKDISRANSTRIAILARMQVLYEICIKIRSSCRQCFEIGEEMVRRRVQKSMALPEAFARGPQDFDKLNISRATAALVRAASDHTHPAPCSSCRAKLRGYVKDAKQIENRCSSWLRKRPIRASRSSDRGMLRAILLGRRESDYSVTNLHFY